MNRTDFPNCPSSPRPAWPIFSHVRPPRNHQPQLDPPRADERRRHGRLRTEEVACSLGEVLDLSASGMKVLRKGRRAAQMGETFTVTLKYGGFALPVDVRVVRLEKIGFRRYIFGLQFEELNPEIQSKLTHLARISTYQRLIPT